MEIQCNAYDGLIHLTLNLLSQTEFLGVVTEDTKWAFNKEPVHHVGEVAVVALRNVFDDLDGVSDGIVMARGLRLRRTHYQRSSIYCGNGLYSRCSAFTYSGPSDP